MKSDFLAGTKERLFALTGLRAIAAYLVFIHHDPPSTTYVGNLIRAICTQGYIGVSIFFVLSGFLIAYNYSDSVEIKASWFLKYFRNRIARIYPIYFFITLLSLLLYRETSIAAWILNLTLLKGFFENWHFSHVAQAWSLTTEETFYFLAPWIFLLSRQGKFPLWKWLGLFYGIGVGLWFLGTHIDFYTFCTKPSLIVIYSFFGRSFEFLLGIQLARWLPRIRRKNSTEIAWKTWGGFAGIIFCMYLLTLCGEEALKNPFGLLIHHYGIPVATVFVICGLITEFSWMRKILETSAFQLLGKSSYAFYLLHMGIFQIWFNQQSSSILLMFCFIQVISILVFYGIEEPLHRLIKNVRIPNFSG